MLHRQVASPIASSSCHRHVFAIRYKDVVAGGTVFCYQQVERIAKKHDDRSTTLRNLVGPPVITTCLRAERAEVDSSQLVEDHIRLVGLRRPRITVSFIEDDEEGGVPGEVLIIKGEVRVTILIRVGVEDERAAHVHRDRRSSGGWISSRRGDVGAHEKICARIRGDARVEACDGEPGSG